MSIARYFNPKLRQRILSGERIGWLDKHPRKQYIVACVLASVDWGDRRAIDFMRKAARTLTLTTGERHVLDHVIPLNHPYVCGLHIAENLRIVTWAVNAYKNNRWSPDQLELFDV